MVGGDPYCCELLLHDYARLGCVDENGWQEIHQVGQTAGWDPDGVTAVLLLMEGRVLSPQVPQGRSVLVGGGGTAWQGWLARGAGLLCGGLARGVPALAPIPGQCSGCSFLASVSSVWDPPQIMTAHRIVLWDLGPMPEASWFQTTVVSVPVLHIDKWIWCRGSMG